MPTKELGPTATYEGQLLFEKIARSSSVGLVPFEVWLQDKFDVKLGALNTACARPLAVEYRRTMSGKRAPRATIYTSIDPEWQEIDKLVATARAKTRLAIDGKTHIPVLSTFESKLLKATSSLTPKKKKSGY